MTEDQLMARATGPSAPPWERRYPGRLKWEIDRLRDFGADPRIDAAELERRRLRIEFEWPMRGKSIALRADFPDSYPRLRPQVFLREKPAEAQRHISPDEGNICLIGRDARQWQPELGLARLLRDQLEDALLGSGVEDPQAEPSEFWWNSVGLPNSFVLIDSAWDLPEIDGGHLWLRYVASQGELPTFRAVVERVLDRHGSELARWSGMLPAELRGSAAKTVRMPWVRVRKPFVPLPGHKSLIELLGSQPALGAFLGHAFAPKLYGAVYGIVHPTELGFGQYGDGWTFPFLVGPNDAFGPRRRKPARIHIVPALRAGAGDIGERVPTVRHLRDKTVAIVGIGAVGAPVAVELARNGCGMLRLLEHDKVEPGNSIRWPIGANAWGKRKLDVLKAHIVAEYGWCDVSIAHHAIGGVGGEEGDDAQLSRLLDGADVVVDGAANFGVTTILDDYCRARGIPLISLWATPPVTGGGVVLYRSGSACPTCLEHHHAEGTIAPPPGLSDEAALLQPAACAERTFTGSSTDLQELSLEAVRLVVDVTAGRHGTTSLIETLSLVDEAGARRPPSWRIDQMPVHPKCVDQH